MPRLSLRGIRLTASAPRGLRDLHQRQRLGALGVGPVVEALALRRRPEAGDPRPAPSGRPLPGPFRRRAAAGRSFLTSMPTQPSAAAMADELGVGCTRHGHVVQGKSHHRASPPPAHRRRRGFPPFSRLPRHCTPNSIRVNATGCNSFRREGFFASNEGIPSSHRLRQIEIRAAGSAAPAPARPRPAPPTP